ncbi:hypothetical protein [Streptosporangium sp. NPDC049046]|uniref:hypothetical protein n=1 Tax=unclassified Streptosporangium TaxID=2632669 RepID=UPI0034269351
MAGERVAARRARPVAPSTLRCAADRNAVSTPPTGASSVRPTRPGYATRRP